MATESKKLRFEPVTDEISNGSQNYLAPFSAALSHLGLTSAAIPESLTLGREQLLGFMSVILRGVAFDEAWYTTRYPDIGEAIRQGQIASAFSHFLEHGYLEGRAPQRVVVDDNWYKAQYPDVAEGIELGEIRSCQEHFDNYGQSEGRLPFKI